MANGINITVVSMSRSLTGSYVEWSETVTANSWPAAVRKARRVAANACCTGTVIRDTATSGRLVLG